MERMAGSRIYIENKQFCAAGKPIWLNGVNTPWHHWNDFGGRFDAAFWDEHFGKLRAAGVNATRIWINCGGLVGVLLEADGSFVQATERHWADLDVLFELACKHGLYVMATLLSFDHFKEHRMGHHLPWRRMIADPAKIDAFVSGYVMPFVQRYGDNPYLFSIDLMNEPDWVAQNPECGQAPWEQLCCLFARCAAVIHQHSQVLVTAGIGIIINNSDRFEGNKVSDEVLCQLGGEGAYVDFYSPHYYHWEKRFAGSPFDQSPTDYGLDGTRPAVIGECAAKDETGVPLADRYEAAWRSGWDGVFAWTSNGVDSCGGYEEVQSAAERMARLAGNVVKIG